MRSMVKACITILVVATVISLGIYFETIKIQACKQAWGLSTFQCFVLTSGRSK